MYFMWMNVDVNADGWSEISDAESFFQRFVVG